MEQTQSIERLIKDIDLEKVVLPEFQRDFVWEINKTYDLFDSMVKDIFIGAIIYGIPSFEIAVRDIDARAKAAKGKRRPTIPVKIISLKDIQHKQKLNKSDFRLVLDGQQRITSLYRALKGIDSVWFISKNDGEMVSNSFFESTLEELLFEFTGSPDPQRLSVKLSDVWQMDMLNEDDDEIREKYFYTSEYYSSFAVDTEFMKKQNLRSSGT